jgi:hypothetical protein
MTTFERFAVIEDDEAVGIRASLLRCETIAAICIKVNLNLMQLFRGTARALACRSWHPRREPFSQLVRTESGSGRLARAPIAAREGACVPRNHPFFLTKLCLIPPFPHE